MATYEKVWGKMRRYGNIWDGKAWEYIGRYVKAWKVMGKYGNV